MNTRSARRATPVFGAARASKVGTAPAKPRPLAEPTRHDDVVVTMSVLQTENLGPIASLPPAEMRQRLSSVFPASFVGPSPTDAAPDRGGREAALARLDAIDPGAYAHSRNHVTGAVTRLSPWIRHGVLSLAEVRDTALARVARPEEAEKLVSELAWRDYWIQVHATLGDAIGRDIEPMPRRSRVVDRVPDDVLEARTGMRCMDDFASRLHHTGWLHNHERMWLASWLVHVRGLDWRAGADWFLEHLLDGDPASNHLSWQWVAGTFAARPYLFNRENLERYTSGIHCRECPLLGRCDVEGGYDELAARLLVPESGSPPRDALRIQPAPAWRAASTRTPRRPLVWLTIDSASNAAPAAVRHPGSPRLFVVDPSWLADERPSLKRLAFLFECLADVPGVEIRIGDPADVVPVGVAAHGCDGVAVADTPCPRVRRAAAAIARQVPVEVVERPAFCDRSRVSDLGRFSRYWRQIARSALRPTITGDPAAPPRGEAVQ